MLTAGPMDFASPATSKDRTKLFVIGELVRYDAKSKRFLPYPSGISAEGVAFTGDGPMVAYVAYPKDTL